ncbi:hypothetical protein MTO96_026049 [Rhipicephalus appendiculatus]
MAAQQPAAGAASEPRLTPLTHRPVVAEESGYHYRWDIQVGDTPSDLDWGDDIVKTDKKLSFEKDVRVQEFDKHQASDVVVHLKRRPDTKERRKHHHRRKHRKKHRRKHRRHRRKKHKRKKKRKKGKKKKSKEKKASPPTSPTPAASPPSRAPSAPAPAPAVAAKPPAEEIPPLPPMGFPDGMIMITTERSESSLDGEPVTETIRMVGSPETFNRLSSQEPLNLQQLIAVSEGGQPLGPFGQTTSSEETPTQQFNVQALPAVLPEAGVVEAIVEPGLTEQVVQAPGGPQIKIRTKTEIEMIQPEEEPPPPPRHGIEAITRQQIEEFPSPDGGEPRYSTSQENIIRRIELPGVRPGRHRSRRFYGANTRGIDISPDARIIRTTSRKVTGADGAPRIDTKVAISPPREGYPAAAVMPMPLQAPTAALAAATSSSGSDVQKEAAILNQLSMMVNSRTDHELKRLQSAERRRRRRARRERRRRRRAARQRRRALKDWESTGDIPFERLQEQPPLTPGMLTMAHSQLFNPAGYMQPPPVQISITRAGCECSERIATVLPNA